MGRRFAGGLGAVVAAEAAAGDAGVVEAGGQPGRGAVTDIAFPGRGDVSRWFADGGGTVVALRTGTDDLGVVDAQRGYPCSGSMAVFADLSRGDVQR